MLFRPGLGFFVKALHILLELLPVHPPNAAATDLDRRQFTRTHERIDLGDAHAQVLRHVVQGEESRLDLGHRRMTIAVNGVGYLNLKAFAVVWPALAETDLGWF